jgi:hypothetical protein
VAGFSINPITLGGLRGWHGTPKDCSRRAAGTLREKKMRGEAG